VSRIASGWVRPEEAAAGALDHLPWDHWPRLAAHWLAAGFDSEQLGQLAALRPWETRAAPLLMPAALRSIGFDPAPANEAFTARCQAALDIVQRDLDVTGHGQYLVRAHFSDGWPTAVFTAFPDGSYWSGGWPMTREMDDACLLLFAAGSVSDTIKEVHEIKWPACAVHDRDPVASIWEGDEPVDLIDDVPWWQCTRGGHRLARVGQLTQIDAGPP
jgi:hypothetical protein